MGELRSHEQSAFITLTYSDDNLWRPMGRASLHPLHLRRFWSRFRKKHPGIRYYACGEYGDQSERPHYHAIVFGWWPEDAQSFGSHGGNPAYLSQELSKLWLNQGTVLVEHVTLGSASYVAGYVQKKMYGRLGAQHYSDRFPPFIRQSQSLGRGFVERFLPDVLSGTLSVPNSDGSARQVPVPRPWLTALGRLHWVCDPSQPHTEHPHAILKRARAASRPPEHSDYYTQYRHELSHELITLARRGQTQTPGESL